ncbi:MAG: hypothetical protein ACT4NY_21505 [Pseudonocardiales bacterium]
MIMWDRCGEELLLSLSPEGVHFLREQWLRLRKLVRKQLRNCSTDPLAELTGIPVPTGPIDWRLAYLVDYWCGTEECGPVQQVRQGWLLHGLERALSRVLAALPRHGGVVVLPARGHPATVEWGSMLETLHVVLDVLDVSDRVIDSGDSERVLLRRCVADAENNRLMRRWLELVHDTLAQDVRTTPAGAGH